MMMISTHFKTQHKKRWMMMISTHFKTQHKKRWKILTPVKMVTLLSMGQLNLSTLICLLPILFQRHQ
eukprot:10162290-Ditylum_brightwellii.AAC.1